MPIGKYANWAACKADGKSDEYCGFLEHHTGEVKEAKGFEPSDPSIMYVQSKTLKQCKSCIHFEKPDICNLPLTIPVDPIDGCCNKWQETETQITESHYMNTPEDNLNDIYSRYLDLQKKGIPEPEIQRAIMSEFAYGAHFTDPWPPRPVGIDQQAPITNHIPSSKYPPMEGITEEGYLSGMDHLSEPNVLEVDSPQYLGTAANTIGSSISPRNEPAHNQRQMPEESWFPRTLEIQELQPSYARFKYNRKENCDICKGYDGAVFDLNQASGRPILPSEGIAMTNTHPNCECTWETIDPLIQGNVEPTGLLGDQAAHIAHVNRIVGQKARHGTLHPLNSDGSVDESTIDFNPRKLMETVGQLKSQFKWLTPKYLEALQSKQLPGKLFLIRAAAETITDHRMEGEPYKRKLSGLELIKMARTAVGKGMDINHNSEWKTPAIVLDSEGDENRREIQMLVLETDPEIINAVNKGIIDAVSINGSAPRSESVEPCNTGGSELCSVPSGVILGETDGIALTWVVTAKEGLNYHGQWIAPAEPGIKITAISPL